MADNLNSHGSVFAPCSAMQEKRMKNVTIARFHHRYVRTCKITYIFAFARLLIYISDLDFTATVAGH